MITTEVGHPVFLFGYESLNDDETIEGLAVRLDSFIKASIGYYYVTTGMLNGSIVVLNLDSKKGKRSY